MLFSLQMVSNLLDSGAVITPEITSIDVETMLQVLRHHSFISCVGHADTDKVISDILGVELEVQRLNVSLNVGDILYVCQVVGGRLPEGCTRLPEGVSLKWYSLEL